MWDSEINGDCELEEARQDTAVRVCRPQLRRGTAASTRPRLGEVGEIHCGGVAVAIEMAERNPPIRGVDAVEEAIGCDPRKLIEPCYRPYEFFGGCRSPGEMCLRELRSCADANDVLRANKIDHEPLLAAGWFASPGSCCHVWKIV